MGGNADQLTDGETIRTYQAGDLAIRYRFYPAPSGNQAVFLLHGWLHSSVRWQSLARQLSNRYTVIAPDLPGFGLSSINGSPSVHLDDLTRAISQFLEHLQTQYELHAVIGHSMGGMILLQAMHDHQFTCNHIGLCSVPVGWTRLMRFMWRVRPVTVPFMRFLAWLPRRISFLIIRLLAWLTVHSYQLIEDSIVEDALKANVAVAGQCLTDILTTDTLSLSNGSRTAHILVARGEYDLIVNRENSQRLSDKLNGVYYEFARVSHTPQLEAEAEFNTVWSGFIDDPVGYCTQLRDKSSATIQKQKVG